MTHEEHQYRFSRSHATRLLLAAMQGEAPGDQRHRVLKEDQKPACGEPFEYAARVYPQACTPDAEPDITCPKCRAMMRAIRPQSAPLFEVRKVMIGADEDTAFYRPVGYVGGEMFEKFADFEARIAA